MKAATTPFFSSRGTGGKLVGQMAPFKLRDIWALRVRLQMENRIRELALFNLGIDRKLCGWDTLQRGGGTVGSSALLMACADARAEPARERSGYVGAQNAAEC